MKTISEELQEIKLQILQERKKNKRLRIRLYLFGAVTFCLMMCMSFIRTAPPLADFSNSILKEKDLIVTDSNDVPRVWIGAPVPDPPIMTAHLLITAGLDRNIYIRDLVTNELRVIKGPKETITDFCIKDNHLISADLGGNINIWEL